MKSDNNEITISKKKKKKENWRLHSCCSFLPRVIVGKDPSNFQTQVPSSGTENGSGTSIFEGLFVLARKNYIWIT